MHPLSISELDRQTELFDRMVAATDQIDHFCSSSAWILPARAALMPPREPWLFRGDEGYVAMMRGRHPQGWGYIEPLESTWGLACPLAGPACTPLVAAFADLCRLREADWDVALVSGVPVRSQLLDELLRRLTIRYKISFGPTTARYVAHLNGGVDGFLGRRSRNFRKALRRALRVAQAAGIEFESCHLRDPEATAELYDRIMGVEVRSWKGHAGVGINTGSMYAFYQDMIARLAATGRLRVIFARHRGQDVAYVLGAVFLHSYRGLQFSFDAQYTNLSLGNLCQYQQIIELCAEGIEVYDLGTEMLYKQRWADASRDSIALIVVQA